MKSVAILFFTFMISFALLYGCGETTETIDYSVDMNPRMITFSKELSTEEVVEAVKPAVVGILASSPSAESVGSGVAVASDGYILTNNHVIEGATKIKLYFANKETASATKIWSDSVLDIAIIKSARYIPYLEMNSSQNLQAGQDVLAIGTPLSLQFKHSATKGIISALNRTVELSSFGAPTYLQNLIQHDASINPGNSGGPLINKFGGVVGINTLKVTDAEGLGFAIPIDVFFPILNKLKLGEPFTAPYSGVFGFDSEIAAFYGKTLEKEGVYVLNVDPEGPAKTAGLIEGDVICEVGDSEIKTMLDFRLALYNSAINEKIELSVLRGEEKLTLQIDLEERK